MKATRRTASLLSFTAFAGVVTFLALLVVPLEPLLPARARVGAPAAALLSLSYAGAPLAVRLVTGAVALALAFVSGGVAAAFALLPQVRLPFSRSVAGSAFVVFAEVALLYGAQAAGVTPAFAVPSLAGRPRLVWPLRYFHWTATTTHLFSSLALVVGTPPREQLTATAALVATMTCGVVLELLPAGGAAWAAALAASLVPYYAFARVVARALSAAEASGAFDNSKLAGVLNALTALAALFWTAFPAAFVAAQLVGGGAAGDAGVVFSVQAEALTWSVLEVWSKVLFVAVTAIVAVSFDRKDAAERGEAATDVSPPALRELLKAGAQTAGGRKRAVAATGEGAPAAAAADGAAVAAAASAAPPPAKAAALTAAPTTAAPTTAAPATAAPTAAPTSAPRAPALERTSSAGTGGGSSALAEALSSASTGAVWGTAAGGADDDAPFSPLALLLDQIISASAPSAARRGVKLFLRMPGGAGRSALDAAVVAAVRAAASALLLSAIDSSPRGGSVYVEGRLLPPPAAGGAAGGAAAPAADAAPAVDAPHILRLSVFSSGEAPSPAALSSWTRFAEAETAEVVRARSGAPRALSASSRQPSFYSIKSAPGSPRALGAFLSAVELARVAIDDIGTLGAAAAAPSGGGGDDDDDRLVAWADVPWAGRPGAHAAPPTPRGAAAAAAAARLAAAAAATRESPEPAAPADASLFSAYTHEVVHLETNTKAFVRKLSFLLVDIQGSTSMYEDKGDAAALSLVLVIFSFLTKIIEARHGTVVKTIGDSMLAVFDHASHAMEAGVDAQLELLRFRAQLPEARVCETTSDITGISDEGDAGAAGSDGAPDGLRHRRAGGGGAADAGAEPALTERVAAVGLKAAVNSGPAIAVRAGSSIDYFGSTMNMTARLETQSEGQDVVFPTVLGNHRSVRDLLEAKRLDPVPFDVKLKGFANTAKLCRVRIELSPP